LELGRFDPGLTDQAPRLLCGRDCFVLCGVAVAGSRRRCAVGVDELPVVAAVRLLYHSDVSDSPRFLVTAHQRSLVHHASLGKAGSAIPTSCPPEQRRTAMGRLGLRMPTAPVIPPTATSAAQIGIASVREPWAAAALLCGCPRPADDSS